MAGHDARVVAMRPPAPAAALAAVLLAIFSASSVRLTDEALRGATRGTASLPATQARVDRERRRTTDPERSSRRPGAVTTIRLILARLRARFSWPAAEIVPAQLAPGASALGTSLPKRLRWKALGGHGRNGPGATL